MHNISLTIGDWSGDGHNMTETTYIKSNLDLAGLKESYKMGKEKSSIDVESYCQDYEDNHFPASIAKKLLEDAKSSEFVTEFMQSCIDEAFQDEDDEDNISIYSDCVYVILWLCVAKIGNAELIFEFDGNYPNINIGGYGLLWN